jgi:cyclohexanone monooxygenase
LVDRGRHRAAVTEQHVDWIAGLLAHLRDHQLDEAEVTPEAEARWVEHVNARAQETIYPRARSYYMGHEVPGKPHVFMPYSGGVRGYRRILERVVAEGYDGFVMRSRRQLASAGPRERQVADYRGCAS